MSWTCFRHCKHHSETKKLSICTCFDFTNISFWNEKFIQFGHALPLQTSFWTIKRCRCSRNSLHKDCFMDFVFVNCFQKLNCTKVVYWKLQLVLGTFVSRRDFEQKYAGFSFCNGISSKFFSWNKISSWWFLDFARILGQDSFALNVCYIVYWVGLPTRWLYLRIVSPNLWEQVIP